MVRHSWLKRYFIEYIFNYFKFAQTKKQIIVNLLSLWYSQELFVNTFVISETIIK